MQTLKIQKVVSMFKAFYHNLTNFISKMKPCKHEYVFKWNDDLTKTSATCFKCSKSHIVEVLDPDYSIQLLCETDGRESVTNIVQVDFVKKKKIA